MSPRNRYILVTPQSNEINTTALACNSPLCSATLSERKGLHHFMNIFFTVTLSRMKPDHLSDTTKDHLELDTQKDEKSSYGSTLAYYSVFLAICNLNPLPETKLGQSSLSW